MAEKELDSANFNVLILGGGDTKNSVLRSVDILDQIKQKVPNIILNPLINIKCVFFNTAVGLNDKEYAEIGQDIKHKNGKNVEFIPIECNFNDRNMIEEIANNFPHFFDLMLFDVNSEYYVDWDTFHFKNILSMLKNGGIFMISDEFYGSHNNPAGVDRNLNTEFSVENTFKKEYNIDFLDQIEQTGISPYLFGGITTTFPSAFHMTNEGKTKLPYFEQLRARMQPANTKILETTFKCKIIGKIDELKYIDDQRFLKNNCVFYQKTEDIDFKTLQTYRKNDKNMIIFKMSGLNQHINDIIRNLFDRQQIEGKGESISNFLPIIPICGVLFLKILLVIFLIILLVCLIYCVFYKNPFYRIF